MTVDMFHTPLLTARETARHLRMPESTLDNWLAAPAADPLVHAVTPERRGWPRVPFVGVVETYVLRSLRELGMPLDDIRKAAALVRAEFDDPYALARRRIATDGVSVFVRLADESLVQARDQQRALREVIESHLRHIDWDTAGNPVRLRLPQYPTAAAVVIDPRFGWGSPVLADSKVKVEDLVALWHAGESIRTVAAEYDMTEAVVEDVLRQAA
jgi:uncharacterized protein (DUF433 family)